MEPNPSSSRFWHSLYLPLMESSSSSSFDFEKVVCSHGFFMMAPNQWDPSSKTLQRPLRLLSDPTTSLTVRISHPSASHQRSKFLLVQVMSNSTSITLQDQRHLLCQVARMLRISEWEEGKIREFHMIHPKAKSNGFGRVFRSPTLFEDMVKSILLCNCQWGRSLDMAKALCSIQLELNSNTSKSTCCSANTSNKKRKREPKDWTWGSQRVDIKQIADFPSSKELAGIDEEYLKRRCNLGYRAGTIVRLAQTIEKGMWFHKLEDAEKASERQEEAVSENVYKQLMKLKGFGSFASSYVLTCLGFYHRIPADSETVRHLKKVHARKRCNKKNLRKYVEDVYDKYSPFQFLAYWSELWKSYEKEFGPLSMLAPAKYKTITLSIPRKAAVKLH